MGTGGSTQQPAGSQFRCPADSQPSDKTGIVVRKSDGGYNYATTDFATVRYSVERLHGDRLLYVVDVRQADHFGMVFAVCRAAGWLPDNVEAKHIGYGTVLGADGKPFKTRSGETVQLILLLDEAIERGSKIVGRAGFLNQECDAASAGCSWVRGRYMQTVVPWPISE